MDQVNDCQSRWLCHVCGHFAGFHRSRNVFATSLRREDCRSQVQHRVGHLVGWLILHKASAIFSVNDDWQGPKFSVWRHLVVVSTSHNVAQSVFRVYIAQGGESCHLCIIVGRRCTPGIKQFTFRALSTLSIAYVVWLSAVNVSTLLLPQLVSDMGAEIGCDPIQAYNTIFDILSDPIAN